MITHRLGRHEVLLPINHKNCSFQEKKNNRALKFPLLPHPIKLIIGIMKDWWCMTSPQECLKESCFYFACLMTSVFHKLQFVFAKWCSKVHRLEKRSDINYMQQALAHSDMTSWLSQECSSLLLLFFFLHWLMANFIALQSIFCLRNDFTHYWDIKTTKPCWPYRYLSLNIHQSI